MEARALTVSSFGSLDELVDALQPGAIVPIHPSISPGRKFLEYASQSYKSRLRDFKLITSVAVGSALALLAGIAVPQYEPVRSSDLYKQIAPLFFDDTLIRGLNGAGFFGGSMLLIFALMAIPVVLDALDARRQNRRAQNLSENGFIFAADTGQEHILPLQAEQAQYLIIKKGDSPRTATYEQWWAAKPNENAAAHFSSLDQLPRYVGEVVVARGSLSTAPRSEDMKAKLGLDAALTGSAGGMLPLSGRIKGEASGEVYSAKQFRILDPATGISAAVVVDAYVPNNGLVPPYELRVASADFGVSNADPNRLVQSLTEARHLGRDVTVIGRVDTSGQIHAEAVAISGRREAYFLGVSQPPPLLKSG
ncbi:hypothetical protein HYV82_06270 [Candidatus Woesearchaeota archaeon]|nr:hypothetical protein [Candidatus Woesearchaeota archaeon]